MPMDIEFPFWEMIINKDIPIVDRRDLHYLTRGVYQVAERLGTDIAQVAEATVYWCGQRPLVVLSSPVNRVDVEKLEEWFGFVVRPANATEISALCGTHVYGIPPAAQAYQMPVLIDHDLTKYPHVWVSAGDPAIWVALTPENLVRVSAGYVLDLKRDSYRTLNDPDMIESQAKMRR